MQKGRDFVKLERLSENQIRCTLDSTDFHMRQMNLGELAYGTPKAKELFQELLMRASDELDFDAEDMPIMIEAIPTSEESVTLLVTRVEDPEELDTRFARFSPSNIADLDSDDFDDSYLSDGFFERADEIIEMVRKLAENVQKNNGTKSDTDVLPEDTSREKELASDLFRAYRFHSLDEICEAARIVTPFYDGENSVYKDPERGDYILVVHKSHHTPSEFNTVCNQLSEYSEAMRGGSTAIVYCEEHMPLISKANALQMLRNI